MGKCSSQKFCYKDSSRVPGKHIWDSVLFLDISASEYDNDIEEIDTSDNSDEKEKKTNTETQ